ncbi:SRPBCC family protein [Tsukamurella soli]|uniref:Polyketide cyclase / dehydrase and lipid transport n=1 Tax=Tsukamurella soli TaxID=644556 RepID=A0ABP8JL63_9ACTN
MTTISHTAVARVLVGTAFAYVADYRTVPDWFFGVSRFVPLGHLDHGLGACFDVAIKVGPKAIRTTVEVTEFEPDRLITLQSQGTHGAVSRWTFAPGVDVGTTALSAEFVYSLPGGFAGRALGALVDPFATQAIRATDAALRRNLERAAG